MSSVIGGLSIRLVFNNPTLTENTGDQPVSYITAGDTIVEYVLTTLALGVGPNDVPLTYAEMAFASSRVSFKVSF